MKKLYFAPDFDDLPRTIDRVIELAKEVAMTEITVQVAELQRIDGTGWCNRYEFVIMDSELRKYCGKSCPGYTPSNRVWGKCVHHTRRFWKPSGKEITIKL